MEVVAMSNYDIKGLEEKLSTGDFAKISECAAENKYYSGDMTVINNLISQAALPFLRSANDAAEFAKTFMNYDGRHALIAAYAKSVKLNVTEIPVLFEAIDFRADANFGGIAEKAGVAIFEAAYGDLDRFATLPKDELLKISRCMSYDIPKKQRLIFGNVLNTALIAHCNCVDDVLSCREHLPTTLEKNEILVGYAQEKNPHVEDALRLYDNVRMSEPVLGEVTKITLLDLIIETVEGGNNRKFISQIRDRVMKFTRESALPIVDELLGRVNAIKF